MNPRGKEIKKVIRQYFGTVQNRVKVFVYRREMCVDVEYEDFHSEIRVENDIRALIGNDCLLGVKREFSDDMVMEMAVNIVKSSPMEVSRRVLRFTPDVYEWMANYERAPCG